MSDAATGRIVKLALIGTAAGLFSGLFGVGGGTVIVPLLVLWLAYPERVAAGTSLAAIAIIAAVAAGSQAGYGNVSWAKALVVGGPAVVGVVVGTAVQQRLAGEAIALLFALLLVASAVDLLVR
jgi:uncharacterized membrane protein YfcA